MTVLLAPNELATNFCRDGRPWSFCDPRQVREPVDWFLGDAQAAMFSVHVADVTYVELMYLRRLGTASGSPVEAIQDRLRQMPELVERYVASLDPPPYWRVIALRYPQMVRYLYGQTRIGAEGDLTVVNAALPPAAAHNLIFATKMALSSPVAPAAIAAPAPGPPAVAGRNIQNRGRNAREPASPFSIRTGACRFRVHGHILNRRFEEMIGAGKDILSSGPDPFKETLYGGADLRR